MSCKMIILPMGTIVAQGIAVDLDDHLKPLIKI